MKVSYNWPQENRTDINNKIFLFIISPFFAFLYSLRTMRTKSSYVVFFLFAVFFGMAFSVPSGTNATFTGDGADYREWFDRYKLIDSYTFINDFEGFLSFDEGKKDFYFDTIAYYTTRITDNYHVMFMVFAIVFAFFMLKSFRFLTAERNLTFSIAGLILSYWFTSNQIFNINGVRFWTAAWVGIYAIFQIFRNNNKRYWMLLLITPYFHGSFWFFIGVLLLAQLTKRFEKIWVVLFIISFFVSNFAIEAIQYFQDSLPSFMQSMINSYTDTEYVKRITEVGTGYSWVPYTFGILNRIYQSLIIYLFIKNSKTIRENKKTEGIYLFLLVWASVFNFLAFVPALGGRFITFVWPLIAYIWLINFKDVKYQKVLYAMPFLWSWNFFVMLYKEYPSVIGFDFIFSNPFYLIYKYLIVG